jgi:predicted RNA binding protein YcfA (HicA-like mRNA interferase family)
MPRRHDPVFEVHEDRGKGSHQMIYHPNINGRPVSQPIICHGRNSEIGPKILKNIIRAFQLPEDLF